MDEVKISAGEALIEGMITEIGKQAINMNYPLTLKINPKVGVTAFIQATGSAANYLITNVRLGDFIRLKATIEHGDDKGNVFRLTVRIKEDILTLKERTVSPDADTRSIIISGTLEYPNESLDDNPVIWLRSKDGSLYQIGAPKETADLLKSKKPASGDYLKVRATIFSTASFFWVPSFAGLDDCPKKEREHTINGETFLRISSEGDILAYRRSADNAPD